MRYYLFNIKHHGNFGYIALCITIQGAFFITMKGVTDEKNNQKTVLAYKRRGPGPAEESKKGLLA